MVRCGKKEEMVGGVVGEIKEEWEGVLRRKVRELSQQEGHNLLQREVKRLLREGHSLQPQELEQREEVEAWEWVMLEEVDGGRETVAPDTAGVVGGDPVVGEGVEEDGEDLMVISLVGLVKQEAGEEKEVEEVSVTIAVTLLEGVRVGLTILWTKDHQVG